MGYKTLIKIDSTTNLTSNYERWLKIVLEDVKKDLKKVCPQPSGDKKRNPTTSSISKRQAEAYALVYVRKLTLAQAAMEMGCSLQNVAKLLKKVDEKVRAMKPRSIDYSKIQRLPTGKDGESLV